MFGLGFVTMASHSKSISHSVAQYCFHCSKDHVSSQWVENGKAGYVRTQNPIIPELINTIFDIFALALSIQPRLTSLVCT